MAPRNISRKNITAVAVWHGGYKHFLDYFAAGSNLSPGASFQLPLAKQEAVANGERTLHIVGLMFEDGSTYGFQSAVEYLQFRRLGRMAETERLKAVFDNYADGGQVGRLAGQIGALPESVEELLAIARQTQLPGLLPDLLSDADEPSVRGFYTGVRVAREEALRVVERSFERVEASGGDSGVQPGSGRELRSIYGQLSLKHRLFLAGRHGQAQTAEVPALEQAVLGVRAAERDDIPLGDSLSLGGMTTAPRVIRLAMQGGLGSPQRRAITLADLCAPPPPPVLNDISPDYATVGSTNAKLTLTGTFTGSPQVNLPPGFTLVNYNLKTPGSQVEIWVNVGNINTMPIGVVNFTITTAWGTSNPQEFIADGPVRMVVALDDKGTSSVHPPALARFVTYTVMTKSSIRAANIPLAEAPSVYAWNCNTPSAGPGIVYATCNGHATTNGNGIFTDEWDTLSWYSQDPGCGYEMLIDLWQWCGPAGWGPPAAPTVGRTFGPLVGALHTDSTRITVNGVNYYNPVPAPGQANPMPPGTNIQ